MIIDYSSTDPSAVLRSNHGVIVGEVRECDGADYPAHVGSCPECGHDGPHTVQHNGWEVEFACGGCGMQFGRRKGGR